MNKIALLSANYLIAIIFVLYVTGCTPVASPEADAAAKSFEVTQDKANLYIINETQNDYPGMDSDIFIDNIHIGSTSRDKYLIKKLLPGKHLIVSGPSNNLLNEETNAQILLTLEGGKNYFISQACSEQYIRCHGSVQLIDEATGKQKVLKSELIETQVIGFSGILYRILSNTTDALICFLFLLVIMLLIYFDFHEAAFIIDIIAFWFYAHLVKASTSSTVMLVLLIYIIAFFFASIIPISIKLTLNYINKRANIFDDFR